MSDIQQSQIEKEAFRYARAIDQEHNLNIIEDAWAACALWLMCELEKQEPHPDCLKALGRACGFEEE